MYINSLLKYRKGNYSRRILHTIFLKKGLDLPKEVELGDNVSFPHNAIGTVIHNNTIIGNNVKIYQNVTIGRADIWNTPNNSKMKKIIIEDNAIVCAGAKILCKEGILTIGKNSIVGANSVLTHSIGDNEIWAGIPAKLIRKRD